MLVSNVFRTTVRGGDNDLNPEIKNTIKYRLVVIGTSHPLKAMPVTTTATNRLQDETFSSWKTMFFVLLVTNFELTTLKKQYVFSRFRTIVYASKVYFL